MTHMCVAAHYGLRARTIVVAVEIFVCPHGQVERDARKNLRVTDVSALLRLTGIETHAVSEGEQRQDGDGQDNGAEHSERCRGRGLEK